MKQFEALWKLPLLDRRNEGRWSLWPAPVLLLAVGIGLSYVMAFASKYPYSAYAFLAPISVAAALLMLLWWLMFLSNIERMCSANTLELTPQLRVSIPWATAATWLWLNLFAMAYFVQPVVTCTLAWTLIFCTLFEVPYVKRPLLALVTAWIVTAAVAASLTAYFPLLQTDALLFTLTITALVLSTVGIARTYPAGQTVVALMLFPILFIPKLNTQLLEGLRGSSLSDWPLPLGVLALAAMALTLYGFVGARGERIAKRHQKSREWYEIVARANNRTMRPHPVPDSGKWPGYTRSLNRALARGDRSILLLGFSFGPSVHWVSKIYAAIFGSAGMWLVFTSIHLPSGLKAGTIPALIVAGCSVVLFAALMNFPNFILRPQKEQNLLSLTPGWPVRTTLNPWLGRFIGLHFLGTYAIHFSIVATLTVALPLAPAIALVAAVGGAILMLVIYAYSMMEYPKIERTSTSQRVVGFSALLIMILIIVYVTAVAGPVLIVLSVLATIAAFVAWMRWRRLTGGVAALPAGRLAR